MEEQGYLTREKDLIIKKSGLPGAGKGLFTRRLITKGEYIIEYVGRISTWNEIKQNKIFNGYVFYVSRNHVVDAMHDKKALGRYANDAKGIVKITGIKNNGTYITKKKKVYIQATRDIPAGTEIFVDYGREYWEAIRYNKKLDAKKLNPKKLNSSLKK